MGQRQDSSHGISLNTLQRNSMPRLTPPHFLRIHWLFIVIKKKRTTTSLLSTKKMVQRCVNTLSREQELSGPEVISYLMGWGDRYISHHFETVPLFPLLNLLKKTFPEFDRGKWVRIHIEYSVPLYLCIQIGCCLSISPIRPKRILIQNMR